MKDLDPLVLNSPEGAKEKKQNPEEMDEDNNISKDLVKHCSVRVGSLPQVGVLLKTELEGQGQLTERSEKPDKGKFQEVYLGRFSSDVFCLYKMSIIFLKIPES